MLAFFFSFLPFVFHESSFHGIVSLTSGAYASKRSMHPETPSDPPRLFINYQGLPLAYTDEGEGPATIVAVHGLPGSIRDFRWLASALHNSFRFIRIELPGFGQSARKGAVGMTIAERAALVSRQEARACCDAQREVVANSRTNYGSR